jgi:PKD repeat protein
MRFHHAPVRLGLVAALLVACGGGNTSPTVDAPPHDTAPADTGAADTTAPIVSITSGMLAATDGSYALTGTFADDGGVVALQARVGAAAPVDVTPLVNPFAAALAIPSGAPVLVTVTATDAAGNEGRASVEVTRMPVTALTAVFSVSDAPSTLAPAGFDASATQDPENRPRTYAWDFGDGATRAASASPLAVHQYAAPGVFTATLTVMASDGATDTATRTVTVVDPAVTVTAPLRLRVIDPRGGAFAGVEVRDRAGALLAITDAAGEATLTAGVDVPLVYELTRDDLATQIVRTRVPASAAAASQLVAMLPRARPVFLADAATGGVLGGALGARVELPANGLVDAVTGAPITGPVAVTITPIDHATADSLAFPGVFEAPDEAGTLTPLGSYGLMEVTLRQDGRRVQLAPGAQAMVEVPYTVAGGAAGDVEPFWSLDPRTGLWRLEAEAAPIQLATDGSGRLVQRVPVSHFSWLNIDVLIRERRGAVILSFTLDGTALDAAMDVSLDYTSCLEVQVRERYTGVRGGQPVPGLLQCALSISAASHDGRFVAAAVAAATGDGTAPIEVPMFDVDALPRLTTGVPVTVAVSGAQPVRYAFDVAAGQMGQVAIRPAAGATRTGTVRLVPSSRHPEPLRPYAPSTTTRLGGASPTAARWYVEVFAGSGTGDVVLELEDNVAPPLAPSSARAITVEPGATLQVPFSGARGDLVRAVLDSPTTASINLSLVDARGEALAFSAQSSVDTGLVELPFGGGYQIRVTNFGGAPVTTTLALGRGRVQAVSAAPRSTSTGELGPGDVAVLFLPAQPGAAIAAHATTPTGGDAPSVHVYDTAMTAFPAVTLQSATVRASGPGDERVQTHVVGAGAQARHVAVIHVAHPRGLPSMYAVTIDRVGAAAAITAGDCPAATTPSLYAAALALADDGVLTACPGAHPSYDGLRFAAPRFTLVGAGRAATTVAPWAPGPSENPTAIGQPPPLGFVLRRRVEVRALTVASVGNGVALSCGDPCDVTVADVAISAPAPLITASGEYACVAASASSQTAVTTATITDLTCTNAGESINLFNMASVLIDGADLAATARGVVLSGAIDATLRANRVVDAPRALVIEHHRGALTLAENELVQGVGDAGATGANNQLTASVTLRPTTGTTPSVVIRGNAFEAFGQDAVALLLAHQAVGATVLVEGNVLRGTAGGRLQTGLVLNAATPPLVAGATTVQNNVFTALGRYGIDARQVDALASLALHNNSLHLPEANASGTAAVRLALRTAGAAPAVAARNNVIVAGAGASRGFSQAATIAVAADHNQFDDVGSAYWNATTSAALPLGASDLLDADPLFVDALLRVGDGSPAIDSGTSTGGVPSSDFAGMARPAGSGHDRGAHER